MLKLFKAVFIITGFTLLDRILGFGFKVYLARNLGEVNFGIYQVALSTFFVMLTFTTSGIPLICSKLTAIARKGNDKKTEFSLVSAALISGIVVSLVICSIVLIFSRQIGRAFADPESMVLLLLMMPAIIFAGVYGSFRGNLWGQKRFVTVSVIELIEQITRIGLVIILALMGFNLLRVTAISMSVALFVTAVCCVATYFKCKGRLKNPSPMMMPFIKQAAPVTFIRASNTVVMGLISIAVPFMLTRTGLSTAESLAVFGASVGMAIPLLYLPLTVIGSLAYVLVPQLSASYAAGDKKSVQKQIETAIAFSLVVASIFVPIFFALGEPLGLFVYHNATAGSFLRFSAWLLVPLAAESIVSSMMNSLNLEKQSFINYLVGAGVMFGFMFVFGSNFRIELLAIGLGLGWTISTVLDIIAIKKRTQIKVSTFVIPLFKCVMLIVPTIFVTQWLFNLINSLPIILSLMIAGGIGFIFFSSLSLVFGVLDISVIIKKFKKKKKTKNRRPIVAPTAKQKI
ncbi:MAG: oligosaccharide flippase family protein [Firmicutes bacterium]|nr:oligosaccharide flippase family protein [Bacillota bacterium]